MLLDNVSLKSEARALGPEQDIVMPDANNKTPAERRALEVLTRGFEQDVADRWDKGIHDHEALESAAILLGMRYQVTVRTPLDRLANPDPYDTEIEEATKPSGEDVVVAEQVPIAKPAAIKESVKASNKATSQDSSDSEGTVTEHEDTSRRKSDLCPNRPIARSSTKCRSDPSPSKDSSPETVKDSSPITPRDEPLPILPPGYNLPSTPTPKRRRKAVRIAADSNGRRVSMAADAGTSSSPTLPPPPPPGSKLVITLGGKRKAS